MTDKPHYKIECDCGRLHIISKGTKPGELEIEVDETEFLRREENARKKGGQTRTVQQVKEENNNPAKSGEENPGGETPRDDESSGDANTIFEWK